MNSEDDTILRTRLAREVWGTMEWLADDAIRPGTGLSLARMTVRAGHVSPPHRHPDCTEVIHVLEGVVDQRIGDALVRLEAGATCRIPPGTSHASAAIGPDDAVLIVAYSSGARTYYPV
jgi:mannose-6-phosphate isomerase-like protein (cupin superfamily)